VPLLVSPAVAAGTIWGLPRDRVVVVVRDDAEAQSDRSVFFTSVGSLCGRPCASGSVFRTAPPW
jgi:hypothetical protein